MLEETPNPAKLRTIEQKYHCQVIRLAHDISLAGHLGREEIAQRILRRCPLSIGLDTALRAREGERNVMD